MLKLKFIGKSLPLLAYLFKSSFLTAQAQNKTINQIFVWNGEYFDNMQGGFYIHFDLDKSLSQVAKPDSQIKVFFYNLLKKDYYSFTEGIENFSINTTTIRKLPTGKYLIAKIIFTTPSKQPIIWTAKGQNKRLFIIKKQSISNLGLWTIKLNGINLDLQFAMRPNTYNENSSSKDSSVAAVLNGFSGQIQKVFAGKKIQNQAQKNYEGEDEIRVGVKTARTISLTWVLDLFKDNALGPKINETFVSSDPYIRNCYTDALEIAQVLNGDVEFGFILSHSTGTMKKIQKTGGTLQDVELIKCVYNELTKMQFSVEKNIIGKIKFIFKSY